MCVLLSINEYLNYPVITHRFITCFLIILITYTLRRDCYHLYSFLLLIGILIS